MAFVRSSSELVIENKTEIGNIFFEEYLPTMNGDVARVYIYCLYLCGSSTRADNNLESISNILGITREDIQSAFTYLRNIGLVIIEGNFDGITYLPIRAGMAKIRNFAPNEFADFNNQMQAIIIKRMILPNEFQEYYAFLKSTRVEQAALCMIAKYCVDLKGTDVGFQYILSVARDWAQKGFKTAASIEEKLVAQVFDKNAVAAVIKKLKLKRTADTEDYTMLERWRGLGFALPIIEAIASYCAKTHRKSFTEIDTEITSFYEKGITDQNKIEAYINEKLGLDKIIKTLLTRLGLDRDVVQIDRDFYNTWVATWHFTPDIIDYAAAQAVGRGAPMSYLNKILSTYFDKKVTTLAMAKSVNITLPAAANITRHSYSDEELNNIKVDTKKLKERF